MYENGVDRGWFGLFTVNDVFRIERVNGVVSYKKNGSTFYTSPSPSTIALYADCSILSTGGRVVNAILGTGIGTSDVKIASNVYNELGQLIDKKLHSVGGIAEKQSVDYRYNIRGWLTSMNNAALTSDGGTTNDDATDYFGMSLSYNTVDTDLGNAQLYNGNIAAMKWSNYPGTGATKQKGYTYTYDAMNRIAGSTFKEKTTAWAAAANNGFSETGYTYDLNGNIKTMQRNDKRGTGWMDNMTYNYGTGTTQSNKLLKVEDTGDDYAGFIDGNPSLATDFTTSTDDYRYDPNGNMINDRNKGIGTSITDNVNVITYNFLNLPETVTKGGNTVRYIYDAAGRKLSQVVTFGTTQKQTDYVGEFTYENDVLQYISHEEGRAMMSSTKLIYTNSYDVLPTDVTAIGATVAAYSANGQKYVRVTSSNTTSGNGILPIGATFPVAPGDRYRIRAKGYRTTNVVYLQVKAGATVLGNTTLPNNSANEGWVEQIVTIPTGATTMQAGLVWGAAPTAGEVFYLNEFEITKLGTTAPEYQYNLKDHLGNVRLTFTSKQETESTTATLEAVKANTERSQFVRYDNARIVNHYLFDHTNGSTPTTTVGGAQRLSGQTNEVYGLARSLSVMPGDVINMEVYGKYIDSNSANRTAALNTLITQIATLTAPAGTVVDGGGYGSSTTSFPFPEDGTANTSRDTETGPKAYLSWLVYDRNYNFILAQSGYDPMSSAPRETGQDAAHEKLMGTLNITEPGYVYIYLSNEEGVNPYEVYFDDFKVDHIKSPVIQTDDYYPFGLAFNSYSRENSVPNKYQYNGKELQTDLSLNVEDYGARMYDPALGRWWVMDRKAEFYFATSPYVYALNQPTNAIDPDGNLVIFVNGFTPNKSEQGTSKYWQESRNDGAASRSFDTEVMNQLNDYNSRYYDGSLSGKSGIAFGGSTTSVVRDYKGYKQGQRDAEEIIANLARDKSGNIIETIKVITHSMGAAYAKGLIRALKEYIEKNNIVGVQIEEFDFAPFQPEKQKVVKGVRTKQYSHSDDQVAGNAPIEGASQEDTKSDKKQEHSIFSFFNQIKKLPAGKYKVVDGKIVPE